MKKEAFFTVERELVFDIDLTDYDDVRTCCSGAKICHKCWPFMTAAIKVMDVAIKGMYRVPAVLDHAHAHPAPHRTQRTLASSTLPGFTPGVEGSIAGCVMTQPGP